MAKKISHIGANEASLCRWRRRRVLRKSRRRFVLRRAE